MKEAWYWCWITERIEERPEPDWSKVPVDRRDRVWEAWEISASIRKRWKLWGPQIAFFERQYLVEVEAEVWISDFVENLWQEGHVT